MAAVTKCTLSNSHDDGKRIPTAQPTVETLSDGTCISSIFTTFNKVINIKVLVSCLLRYFCILCQYKVEY